jgi:hypothetical protein
MVTALNMLDLAALEQKPLKKAVLISMFKGQLPSPMEQLPVENAQSLAQQVVRMTDAGTPTTRNLGDAVAAYKASFSDRTETLKIIENKITMDKIYLDIKTFIQDPLALQLKSYSMIVKLTVNNLFINGDPGADTTAPAGVQYRLNRDATFVGQSVDAAGADVNTTDDLRNSFLDTVDNAVTLCGGGAPDMMVVNRQTWLMLRSILRRLKYMDLTKDSYDRQIMVYGGGGQGGGGIKIINAGQVPANALDASSAGQVILNGGNGAGGITDVFGNANATVLYLFQTQGEDGVKLLELFPLRTLKVGIDPGNPGQYVVDVTWPIGFSFPYIFCVSSVQGFDTSTAS